MSRMVNGVPERVLVTGGQGQLGEELALFLKEQNRLGGEPLEVWAPGRQDLDVADLEGTLSAVRSAFGGRGPDVVVHAAAQANVDACELDPDMAYRVNALGARNVAVACRESGTRMVYISTDYVFDGTKGSGYTEYDPVNPTSVYGHSKLMGEVHVREQVHDHYIVRTAWLYGRAGRNNFVRAVLRLALDWRAGTGKEIRMVNDQVGGPTHTLDLAAALWQLVRRPTYGTFHLTNSGGCSRFEFTRKILEVAGMDDVPVQPVTTDAFPRPARRPAYSVLENAAWRREGHAPLRSWEDALADYLRTQCGDLLSAPR